MNKNWWIVISIIALFLVAFLFFRFTGYAVSGSDVNVEIVRLVEDSGDLVVVKLGIVSQENVLGIKEFVSEECGILNYSLDKELDLFEFKPSENTWILANRSEGISVELVYEMASGCEVTEGEFYIVNDEAVVSGGFGEDSGDTAIPGGDDGGTGGGGSSGGGGSAGSSGGGASDGQIISTQIVEAESQEEYASLVDSARNLLGIVDESQRIEWGSFGLIIVLSLIGAVIILFIVVAFVKRPENKFAGVKR